MVGCMSKVGESIMKGLLEALPNIEQRQLRYVIVDSDDTQELTEHYEKDVILNSMEHLIDDAESRAIRYCEGIHIPKENINHILFVPRISVDSSRFHTINSKDILYVEAQVWYFETDEQYIERMKSDARILEKKKKQEVQEKELRRKHYELLKKEFENDSK